MERNGARLVWSSRARPGRGDQGTFCYTWIVVWAYGGSASSPKASEQFFTLYLKQMDVAGGRGPRAGGDVVV